MMSLTPLPRLRPAFCAFGDRCPAAGIQRPPSGGPEANAGNAVSPAADNC